MALVAALGFLVGTTCTRGNKKCKEALGAIWKKMTLLNTNAFMALVAALGFLAGTICTRGNKKWKEALGAIEKKNGSS